MASSSRPADSRIEGGKGAAAPASQPPSSKARNKKEPAPVATRPEGPVDVIVCGCPVATEQYYVPALRELETRGVIRVCAVVDEHPGTTEKLQGFFPTATPAISIDRAVVAPGALTILSTPARLHGAQASAALKRGWHVFCSSPLATSAKDGAQMIAAARRHERMLAVDLHRRFSPAADYLAVVCRDQLLGPIVNVEVHDGVPPAPVDPGCTISEMPDGVLTEFGPHAIDLLTRCLGPATLVRYADDAMGGVEANALLELAFPEGVRGTIHLSRDWPTSRSCQLVFERGLIRWNFDSANQLTVQLASAPAAVEGILKPALSWPEFDPESAALPSTAEAFRRQFEHVLAAIQGREPLQVGAAEAAHQLPLVDECYATRTLLEQPWLSRNETARARTLSTPTAIRRP